MCTPKGNYLYEPSLRPIKKLTNSSHCACGRERITSTFSRSTATDDGGGAPLQSRDHRVKTIIRASISRIYFKTNTIPSETLVVAPRRLFPSEMWRTQYNALARIAKHNIYFMADFLQPVDSFVALEWKDHIFRPPHTHGFTSSSSPAAQCLGVWSTLKLGRGDRGHFEFLLGI